VYLNALPNGFIYDDNVLLLNNPFIRDVRNIPELFRRNFWTFEGAPPTSNYYRPLVNFFYLVAYQVSGSNPAGFHATNILFHAGVSLLVFFITLKLLIRSPLPHVNSSLVSLVVSLLFATHPIHTEAVSWNSGLPDVSFSFFYLFAFYLYLTGGSSLTWWHAVSAGSFFLATLCKEPAITLPLVLLVHDYALSREPVWSVKNLKKYLPYLLVAFIYMVIRISVLGAFAPLEPVEKMGTVQSLINIFPLFTGYLKKMFLPIDLNFWTVFNPITSLLSEKGILGLFVSGAFAGVAFLAFKKNRVLFFGLLLFLIPLLPVFYTTGITGFFFAERYLYLPSFGFILSLVVFCFSVPILRWRSTIPLTLIFFLLAGAFATGTVVRNRTWKDAETLFADAAKKSPQSVIPHMEYGNALLAKDKTDQAIQQYQLAIAIDPKLYVLRYHLGLGYAKKGLLYEAIAQFSVASELNPYFPDSHVQTGRAAAKLGLMDMAIGQFEIAISLQSSPSTHNLLGVAYAQKGLLDRAEEQFRIAFALDPSDPVIRGNLEEIRGKEPRKIGRGGDYGEHPERSSRLFNFVW
jgi:tetratricopeptide (TPR) repeat protein